MRQHVIYTSLMAGTLAALAGCRQDPNILLLRRDLRLHEDQIYRLEDALAEYEDRLASCHRQNEALKRRVAGAEGGVAESPLEPPVDAPRDRRPDRKRPPVDEPLPPANGVGPPKIDLGTETPPELIEPKGEPKRLPKSPEPEPSAHTNPKRQRGPIHPAAHADAPHVRSIAINPRLSGGNNTDGRFGDEGVMLVLETRDDNGRLVEAPGETSLVVLDPAESGHAAQVAQWDFTADDLAVNFRRTRLASGYTFELPWPGERPKHEQLTLRVRYTTPNGRTLTAEHPFKAEIPDHDEFLTRSVRAPRIKTWSPDRESSPHTNPKRERGVIDVPIPAAHDDIRLEPSDEQPPARSALHPRRSTAGARPEWRPER
jgi:hypothetical protein